MKTVKFRIWNGMEMVFDITSGKFGTFYVNPENGDGLNPDDSASLTVNTTKYHDGTPLMQYSGFKDKNSKEIYEGDIYKIGEEIGYVDFKNGSFIWTGNGYPMSHKKIEFIEIIGNVFQNPELIEAAN